METHQSNLKKFGPKKIDFFLEIRAIFSFISYGEHINMLTLLYVFITYPRELFLGFPA